MPIMQENGIHRSTFVLLKRVSRVFLKIIGAILFGIIIGVFSTFIMFIGFRFFQ